MGIYAVNLNEKHPLVQVFKPGDVFGVLDATVDLCKHSANTYLKITEIWLKIIVYTGFANSKSASHR